MVEAACEARRAEYLTNVETSIKYVPYSDDVYKWAFKNPFILRDG